MLRLARFRRMLAMGGSPSDQKPQRESVDEKEENEPDLQNTADEGVQAIEQEDENDANKHEVEEPSQDVKDGEDEKNGEEAKDETSDTTEPFYYNEEVESTTSELYQEQSQSSAASSYSELNHLHDHGQQPQQLLLRPPTGRIGTARIRGWRQLHAIKQPKILTSSAYFQHLARKALVREEDLYWKRKFVEEKLLEEAEPAPNEDHLQGEVRKKICEISPRDSIFRSRHS